MAVDTMTISLPRNSIGVTRQTRRNAVNLLGRRKAENWISSIPRRLRNAASTWGLVSCEEELPGSTRAAVLRCRTVQGTEVVLKLAIRADDLREEHAALQRWTSGAPVVKAIGYDPDQPALLLPWIKEEAGSTTVAGHQPRAVMDLLAGLQQPSDNGNDGAQILEDMERRLQHACERLPEVAQHAPVGEDDLEQARQAFRRLARDPQPCMLVHGDLHAGNVLPSTTGGGQLIAIDPRNRLIGDRHYDAATWALKEQSSGNRFTYWVEELQRAGYDRQRLLDWARVIHFHDAVAWAHGARNEPWAYGALLTPDRVSSAVAHEVLTAR